MIIARLLMLPLLRFSAASLENNIKNLTVFADKEPQTSDASQKNNHSAEAQTQQLSVRQARAMMYYSQEILATEAVALFWEKASEIPALFRGDTRAPVEVFATGFHPAGSNTDIQAHIQGADKSAYVSTTRSTTIAAIFGSRNPDRADAYIYQIDPNNLRGYWLPGYHTPFGHISSEQLEFAVDGVIPTENIIGVYRFQRDRGQAAVLQDLEHGRFLSRRNLRYKPRVECPLSGGHPSIQPQLLSRENSIQNTETNEAHRKEAAPAASCMNLESDIRSVFCRYRYIVPKTVTKKALGEVIEREFHTEGWDVFTSIARSTGLHHLVHKYPLGELFTGKESLAAKQSSSIANAWGFGALNALTVGLFVEQMSRNLSWDATIVDQAAIATYILPMIGCPAPNETARAQDHGFTELARCRLVDIVLQTPSWPLMLALQIAHTTVMVLNALIVYDEEDLTAAELEKQLLEGWSMTLQSTVKYLRSTKFQSLIKKQWDAQVVAILFSATQSSILASAVPRLLSVSGIPEDERPSPDKIDFGNDQKQRLLGVTCYSIAQRKQAYLAELVTEVYAMEERQREAYRRSFLRRARQDLKGKYVSFKKKQRIHEVVAWLETNPLAQGMHAPGLIRWVERAMEKIDNSRCWPNLAPNLSCKNTNDFPECGDGSRHRPWQCSCRGSPLCQNAKQYELGKGATLCAGSEAVCGSCRPRRSEGLEVAYFSHPYGPSRNRRPTAFEANIFEQLSPMQQISIDSLSKFSSHASWSGPMPAFRVLLANGATQPCFNWNISSTRGVRFITACDAEDERCDEFLPWGNKNIWE